MSAVKRIVGARIPNQRWRTNRAHCPRELNSGRAFYSRILINRSAHTYLGYELILEPQQPAGAYLLTFGKLGTTHIVERAGAARGLRFSVEGHLGFEDFELAA